jgi:hypothetical protein
MKQETKHEWAFRARFRRRAFGWKSQPAIARVKEAVAEIKQAARKDRVLAAEGAVLFMEKVSPALEQVDSSSGAIGTAVNKAVEELAAIIAQAPVDETRRDQWLERLWQAVEEDGIPYIDLLPEHWGELCVSQARASRWADGFIDIVRRSWSPDPGRSSYYKGTSACMSALLKAGRNEELLALLEIAPFTWWHYRQWGMKALVAMGKKAEALRYAEESRGTNDSPIAIARACEDILLSSGLAEEAYNRYAIEANRGMTHLATYRAITKRYPHKEARDILRDLAASTPGEEGKWFAAAKSAGLWREAIKLANLTPCDPRTLTRAARDMGSAEPLFAVQAGLTALRWLAEGYGYEISSLDIREAYDHTMQAAEKAGCKMETHDRIRALAASDASAGHIVAKVLGRELDLKL